LAAVDRLHLQLSRAVEERTSATVRSPFDKPRATLRSRPLVVSPSTAIYIHLMSPACVLLVGIPASGKSSFFRSRFGDTHVRVCRDMLGTDHRVRLLRDACLAGGIPFVLDNTNLTRAGRAEHIRAARAAGFRVEGYFLQSRRAECIERNRGRPEAERVPAAAVGGMSRRLELPARVEGFDALFFVRLAPGGGFEVQDWSEPEGS
jgi:predicted kinase